MARFIGGMNEPMRNIRQCTNQSDWAEQQRKKRKPDAAAGKVAIVLGGSVLILTIFFATDTGQRLRGIIARLIALPWGLKEITAARKWEQEPEEKHYATSAKDILESEREEKMEKSGSMHNVFKLLSWIFLLVIVVSIVGIGCLFLFHRPHWLDVEI